MGYYSFEWEPTRYPAPGTYFAFAYYIPRSGNSLGIKALSGLGFITFQIGTTTPEKKIATSCAD